MSDTIRSIPNLAKTDTFIRIHTNTYVQSLNFTCHFDIFYTIFFMLSINPEKRVNRGQ